jgi:N6-L-threonylcarbamoyladenine synthase/protein kinase Bud32
VGASDLAGHLTTGRVRTVGRFLARLHGARIVHGDPTTRNVRVADGDDAAADPGRDPALFLIDFGLGFHSAHVEDHAMDLHVFAQSVEGTAADPAPLLAALREGYADVGDPDVLDRLRDIEGRGRYQ